MVLRTDIVDDDELVPGTAVGEYVVDGQLGEGGMGTVYAATHPVIAKRAAIKVLHPALSVNREAVERFVQEARAVNQINHPNIVDIFAFGTLPDGRSYFVMEQLKGETLRDRMAQGALPTSEVLAVLITITLALEAAHERGVVHRDLKPDNIYLVAVKHGPPTIKLLDFGIAKLVGGDKPALSHRTRTGNLLGTPAYMSPEQARGLDVDHRTDIYALGALAFELVTGQLPYPADTGADMIAKHLHAPVPSASDVNMRVPTALDRLIQGMLDKNVDKRPTLAQVRLHLQTYGELASSGVTASSMAPLVGAPMATPPPAMTSPPRASWKIAVAVAIAVLAASIVFVALRGESSPDIKVAAPPPSPPATPVDRTKVTSKPTPEPTPEPTIEPITEPAVPAQQRPVEPKRPVAKPAKPATSPSKPDKAVKRTKPSDDDDAPM